MKTSAAKSEKTAGPTAAGPTSKHATTTSPFRLGNRAISSLLQERKSAQQLKNSYSSIFRHHISKNDRSEAIPHKERQAIENRLGLSLYTARLHQSDEVNPLLSEVHARAATLGRHIFISPQLPGPKRVNALNHELVHVAQNAASEPDFNNNITLGRHDTDEETQAQAIAAGTENKRTLRRSSPNVIRRQDPETPTSTDPTMRTSTSANTSPVSSTTGTTRSTSTTTGAAAAPSYNPVSVSLDSASPWLVVPEEGAAASDVAYELYGVDLSPLMETEPANFSFSRHGLGRSDQYIVLQPFLRERYKSEFFRKMDNNLDKDVRRVKDILLETFLDSDDERILMMYIRRWERNKIWRTSDGKTYFDKFLSQLSSSRLYTNYLVTEGSRRSFLDELYSEIEDDAGELNTLIAKGSIEFGGYRPLWHQIERSRQGREPVAEINKTLVDRATDLILDRLEGATTGAESSAVRDVLVGLPPREQGAVLRQVMSRHAESNVIGLGRFGEPTESHMLFYLFENLDEKQQKDVAEALVRTGVMTPEATQTLIQGRSLAGQYLPMTTYWGEEATQFYADLAVQRDNNAWMVPGAFAALWTPETATSTIMTLGSAGLGGALAKAPLWLQKTALVVGTGSAAYQGTLALTELISGKDAYTGRQLSDVELLSRGLLVVANAIFVGVGFYGAVRLSGGSASTGLARTNPNPSQGGRTGTGGAGQSRTFGAGNEAVQLEIHATDAAGNVRFTATHASGAVARGQINMATGNGTAVMSNGTVVNIQGGQVVVPRPALPASTTVSPSTAGPATGTGPILDLVPTPSGAYVLPARTPALLPGAPTTLGGQQLPASSGSAVLLAGGQGIWLRGPLITPPPAEPFGFLPAAGSSGLPPGDWVIANFTPSQSLADLPGSSLPYAGSRAWSYSEGNWRLYRPAGADPANITLHEYMGSGGSRGMVLDISGQKSLYTEPLTGGSAHGRGFPMTTAEMTDPTTETRLARSHLDPHARSRMGTEGITSTRDPLNYVGHDRRYNEWVRRTLEGRLSGSRWKAIQIAATPRLTTGGYPIVTEEVIIQLGANGQPVRAWRFPTTEGYYDSMSDINQILGPRAQGGFEIPVTEVPQTLIGQGQ